ncbi:stretch-activated Ca2+-permeable channel component-domain-containing protein [Lactarius pseudohatsudake]|nr:stretch-activated Ca2+-permeable channel component-domain-containing protein [Lactarius pseudohatsudake]
MLPQFLWAIVLSFFLAGVPSVRAQTTTALSFGTPVTLTGKNFSTTSAPTLFSLPSSSSEVTISLALCVAASTNPPHVFVSNSSDPQVVPGSNGGADVFGVQIGSLGLGNFTLGLSSESTAGVLAVYGGASSDSLEIGVTQATPLHAPVQDLPFFGDSTANEALLFSPPFLPPEPAPQPTFPNYTLPQANISLSSAQPSQNSPNFTLFLAPLSAGLSALPQTACAIRAGVTSNTQAAQSARVLAEQLWLRDELGWRKEWLVGLLTPLTNYSVYAIQDGTRLAGPIYFTTKSASFSCQLVHALPYCPTTAYAVPLPAPPARALAYNSSNLPTSLTTPLLGYLTNFTTSLLTTACGRDAYSPLQSCADCQAAYRRWLCSISLPRCGEFPQTPSDPQQQQTLAVPTPALVPQMSGTTPRNAALGNAGNYTALLPCIEMCNAVDRTCPVFLGFRCPLPQFTAYASYGVGYIDSADGQVKDGGVPGVPQDQWGNVFCNVS